MKTDPDEDIETPLNVQVLNKNGSTEALMSGLKNENSHFTLGTKYI